MEQTGIIFNIQHYSVHDGPGIRTVVFLKGCPLRCLWCANPESQKPECQMAWDREKCIGCRSCIEELGSLSCRFEEGAGLKWEDPAEDRDHPADWEAIAGVCPSEAFHVIGRRATVEEVLSEVEKDAVFYGNSGGGITLSGGEPLMQHTFAVKLLREARGRGMHTAMETSGYAAFAVFREAVAELDYLLMDVKAYDDSIHRKYTGVSNRRILSNLKKIRELYPELPIHVRTPVIPGVNDNEQEIGAIAGFLQQFRGIRYELLKYHRYGQPKYGTLNRKYEMGEVILEEEVFEKLKKFERFD